MSDEFVFGGEVAWRPSAEYRDRSRLAAFIARHGLRDYDHLLQRSVTDPEWFWPAVFDDLGIVFYEPYTTLLDTSRGVAWARWCVSNGTPPPSMLHSPSAVPAPTSPTCWP